MRNSTIYGVVAALTLALGGTALAQQPQHRGGGERDRGADMRRDDDRRGDDRGFRANDRRNDRDWRRDDRRSGRDWRREDRRDDRRDARGPDRWDDRRGARGPDRWDDRRADNRRGAGPDRSYYRGSRLPPHLRTRQYVVENWRGHRLRQPPRGYHWVQAGSDYLLVAVATGIIADLILNH